MKKKRIFILLGHPDKETSSGYFANEYERGAREAGHEVRRVNLGDLNFDPILHKGYKVIQDLEPDLVLVQENVKWCEHFVILYPVWFSTMPALLKGLFDRVWLPDFAYDFPPGKPGWRRLLAGRTARVFATSDAHPILARFIFGDSTNEIKRGILWFAGFRTSVKKIGPMKNLRPAKRLSWANRMYGWGRRTY